MVAHGEGNFYTDGDTVSTMITDHLIPLQYAREGKATQSYPENPNGSLNAIAGVCDPTGRIFGLMPHPERFVEVIQHPNWRRGHISYPHGLPFFKNAIRYIK